MLDSTSCGATSWLRNVWVFVLGFLMTTASCVRVRVMSQQLEPHSQKSETSEPTPPQLASPAPPQLTSAEARAKLETAKALRRSKAEALGLPALPTISTPNVDPFVPPSLELQSQLAPFSGITSTGDVWSPNLRGTGGFNNKEKWRHNPYWQYFRRVWGNAPFIDANFRLWLSGALKGEFSKPSRPVRGQTTKALPAALRYFDSRFVFYLHGFCAVSCVVSVFRGLVYVTFLFLQQIATLRYDPTIDTPYDSAYDLFSQPVADQTPWGEFYLQPRLRTKPTSTGTVSPCQNKTSVVTTRSHGVFLHVQAR